MSGKQFIDKLRRQPAVVRLWSERTLHLFATDSAGDGALEALDIRINDADHIHRFEQTVSWLTRAEFIAQYDRRIKMPGMFIFTVANADGPLLGYGIAHAGTIESVYTHVDQRVIWSERTGTIYGGFIHPAARGRRLHAALQAARVRYLIADCGMRWVVSGVTSDNPAALRSAKVTKSSPVADLTTKYRFGRASKSVIRHSSGFVADFVDATA